MKENSAMLKKIFCAIFLGILCVYFLGIVYINFSGTPSFYCTDMYVDMLYAVEAWESKSLFPPNWVFGNQLYVVATPVLASLVYGIVGDPLKAMAIASTVYGFLVLVTFIWMLKPAIEDREARWFGAILFLTAMLYFGDATQWVNGWQLLFTMCSYYACYAVTAFLAFGCYLRGEKPRGWRFYGVLGVTCLLCFGTGMQSLRQTAVMTLPLLGVAFLQTVFHLARKEKWATPSLGIGVVLSVCNLLGVLCAKFLRVNQHMIIGEVRLSFLPNGADSIFQCVRNILSLFERPSWREYAAFLLLIACFLVCGVYLVRGLIKGKDESPWETGVLLGLLTFAVFAILAAELLTTMTVRNIYYFMIYPLLAFGLAKGYVYGKRHLRTGMVLILAVVLLIPSFGKLTDSCVQARNREAEPDYAVSSYLKEQGYTTVYSDFNQGERIAIASGFTIKAGFWDAIPFSSVPYLCDLRVYDADSSQCVYVFEGDEEEKMGLLIAEEKGYPMIPLKFFPDSGIHLYVAPVNLMDRTQFE